MLNNIVEDGHGSSRCSGPCHSCGNARQGPCCAVPRMIAIQQQPAYRHAPHVCCCLQRTVVSDYAPVQHAHDYCDLQLVHRHLRDLIPPATSAHTPTRLCLIYQTPAPTWSYTCGASFHPLHATLGSPRQKVQPESSLVRMSAPSSCTLGCTITAFTSVLSF